MIPASELASLQAAAAAALDTACTIERATKTSDGAGGFAETLSTVATCQAGLSQPSGQLLQNYAYLIGAADTWQVRVPVGTDVAHNDQLSLGGRLMRVQVILSPRSYATTLTLLASTIQ